MTWIVADSCSHPVSELHTSSGVLAHVVVSWLGKDSLDKPVLGKRPRLHFVPAADLKVIHGEEHHLYPLWVSQYGLQ